VRYTKFLFSSIALWFRLSGWWPPIVLAGPSEGGAVDRESTEERPERTTCATLHKRSGKLPKGGYGYRWWKANDIEGNEGYNALPMRWLPEHLHDPDFWKALGKARSWQDTGAWLFHWHRFIDQIALSKDVESFFANL
jgi:hypothetical protein